MSVRPDHAAVLSRYPKIARPNLFPSSLNGDDLRFLRDIFKGHVPVQGDKRRNPLESTKGWLKLAVGSDEVPSYINPSEDQETKKGIRYNSRPSEVGRLEVAATRLIARDEFDLSAVFYRPQVGSLGVHLPSAPSLLDLQPRALESAVMFSGYISLEEQTKGIVGVHFPSGHQQGWARVTEL